MHAGDECREEGKVLGAGGRYKRMMQETEQYFEKLLQQLQVGLHDMDVQLAASK